MLTIGECGWQVHWRFCITLEIFCKCEIISKWKSKRKQRKYWHRAVKWIGQLIWLINDGTRSSPEPTCFATQALQRTPYLLRSTGTAHLLTHRSCPGPVRCFPGSGKALPCSWWSRHSSPLASGFGQKVLLLAMGLDERKEKMTHPGVQVVSPYGKQRLAFPSFLSPVENLSVREILCAEKT